MEQFSKKVEIRWSDLDPNFHVLHSKYYDFGAYCRMAFLVENGLTPGIMQAHHFGPILFREEAIFKRELSFGDDVLINVRLQKLSSDFSRWSMQHEIWKKKETLSAIINIDGAWIDTQKRKLTAPPAVAGELFAIAPRTDDFCFTQSNMIAATKNLYRQAYSGLTNRIWLLSIVMLINRSGTMVLAFMTLYCRHLGFSIEQGGLVVAIYGIGSVTGAILGGKISDRFGFYYTQFGALFCGGILFIVLGRMNSYIAICTCTFFLSMVNESFRPANASAIAHYSTEKNRTQSFSLVRLAINLGWGIGVALGGFLASFDYHLLFWVDGFTSILAAMLLLVILPKVSLAQQHNINAEKPAPIKRASPYRDRTFLYFLGFKILFATCFFQLFTTVPLFFKDSLKLDEFWIGVVMSINGIIIALFEMVIVFKLEGKRPYLTLMCYGATLMGISFLLLNLPLASGFLVAIIAMLVITVAEMISMPFMNSYYISRSTEQTRGQYAGMYTMAWSAAQVIGSGTGALVAEKVGFFNLWFIACAICFVAAGGYYWIQRKLP
jgi:predicted MFS family arabinose efflux permease/acyl-CoA thioesterase FadM